MRPAPIGRHLPARRSRPPAIQLPQFAVSPAPPLLICRSVRLPRRDSRWQENYRSQGLHGAAIELFADLFGEDGSLDFQRCSAREILGPKNVPAHALVGKEVSIAKFKFTSYRAVYVRCRIRMRYQYELFVSHGALRPQIVSRKDAEFFYGQALKYILNIFRIYIFAFRRDDHIFLAPQ